MFLVIGILCNIVLTILINCILLLKYVFSVIKYTNIFEKHGDNNVQLNHDNETTRHGDNNV